MRKRFLGLSAFGVLALIVFSSAMADAQRQRPRPAGAPAAQVNLKVTYKMTAAGQTSESTTMIKGPRQRSEMRMGYMDMVTVTQCDLKRTIQIGDKARKYVITPMETVDAASPAPTAAATTNTAAPPTTRGGVITYITSAVDTGERKEMFGFQARHIKSSMSMESSPDACTPVNQRTETDGWYIDLSVDFNCELGRQGMMSPPTAPGGCRDRIAFKNTGAARTGFPLVETTTMYGPDGKVMFTSTREVLELSREPLDAALFDIPAGYAETQNSQELYVMPSVSEMTAQATQGRQSEAEPSTGMPAAAETKRPGTLRVGVVQINNKTERQVSTESLRQRLVGQIQGNGIEAIPLNAISAMEAEAECKTKQCDFILYTDITALKTSAAKKIGGMFGRVAGVGGIDKTESKLEFKLFAVGETSPRLQSGASAKEEGDEASAGTAIDQEAKMVTAEVRKKK